MAFLSDAFFFLLRVSVFSLIGGHGQSGGIMISTEEYWKSSLVSLLGFFKQMAAGYIHIVYSFWTPLGPKTHPSSASS